MLDNAVGFFIVFVFQQQLWVIEYTLWKEGAVC